VIAIEDERGVIQDLLGEIDSVTMISTKAGCVRGNHVHRQTDQWTFVVSGRILAARGEGYGPRLSRSFREVGEGTGHRMILEEKGVAHAWKALEDTLCLVFTKGPRSGENYESDTYRLDEPLLT
jgi:dTDP-4-dehydrorhamnose 3,5-epimerase-like enzyme